jgi:hypothetical protein
LDSIASKISLDAESAALDSGPRYSSVILPPRLCGQGGPIGI